MNWNLNKYLKVPVGTKLQQKPKLSVVQFAGARSHQVDQVEVVLQVCQDLHLAEERRQLRPVERVVDGLDGDLRHRAGIEKALSLADVHAAEVAAAQQLSDFEFWSEREKVFVILILIFFPTRFDALFEIFKKIIEISPKKFFVLFLGLFL